MNSWLNQEQSGNSTERARLFLIGTFVKLWYAEQVFTCTLYESARAFGRAKALVQIFETDVQVSQKDPRMEIFFQEGVDNSYIHRCVPYCSWQYWYHLKSLKNAMLWQQVSRVMVLDCYTAPKKKKRVRWWSRQSPKKGSTFGRCLVTKD